MAEAKSSETRTWQQTKSALTRESILDAALDCFHDDGYAATTTEKIASRAGLSRGAMLHHFANRFELVRAAIDHLNERRLRRYAEEGLAAQAGAEQTRISDGIDVYWRQLKSREFTIVLDLRTAARTDPALRDILTPALKDFERAAWATTQQLFPDLARSKEFQRATLMTGFLLDGMAFAQATHQENVPETLLLDWLKEELRRSFDDVRSEQQGERAAQETPEDD
ncbi:MAG: helix-turn-helix domain-containing protein [Pseudomonadota bacterium]